MRLQYLFRDQVNRQAIEDYNYSHDVIPTNGKNKGNVTRVISPRKEITPLNNTCWTVEFYLKSDDDESARHLSKIHEDITRYSPIVLLNEVSQYFTRKLYPFVNEFEVKLRKFLFLAFSLTNDDKLWRAVKTLDKDDFYTIYVNLFTSKKFNKELNELFAENHPAYTKAGIFELIEKIQEESTVWDTVIGDKLGIIKQNFQIIKIYRNDVMHAHYMNHESYKLALSLFSDVNSQLDTEIDTMYHGYEPVKATSATMTAVDELLAKYGNTPMSEVERIMPVLTPDFIDKMNRILPYLVIPETGAKSIEQYRDIVHEIIADIGAITHCDAHDDFWYNTGRFSDEEILDEVLKEFIRNPIYTALKDKTKIESAVEYTLNNVAYDNECPFCQKANDE